MKFSRDIKLGVIAAILSVYTVAAFHFPFFRHALSQTQGGFNGVMIIASLVLLMLLLDYFAACLVLWLGRIVGKILTSLSLIVNAGCLYFINTYDVMLDDTMMGNVYNTNTAEATSYFSGSFVLYVLLMGVLPAVLLMLSRIDYGKAKGAFSRMGIALLGCLAIGFGNMTNWPWVDKNSTVLGSLILPWSYTVNTFRYYGEQRENNREEILLPDATLTGEEKEVVVLVIGESARRDHFSLYGYGRETNPLLSQVEGLRAYPANSAATYTTGGVKAILSHSNSSKLYEILPNYLHRAGVDVIWRTSNWGQPPLHIEKYYSDGDLGRIYDMDPAYDNVLSRALADTIAASRSTKVLVVLHTSLSHGPSYNRKYPPEFERFTPVSNSVEMSTIPQDQLINAYDNTILFTDWFLWDVISQMKGLEEWKSCVMFVSDHGESLGEGNLYMHGVPISISPREQYEIPFIVWCSEGDGKLKDAELLSQYHVFHSVLDFLEIDSPVYNPEYDIFKR